MKSYYRNILLRISKRLPFLYKILCVHWNNNTITRWDAEYAANESKNKWNSHVRLYFYDLVAKMLPKEKAKILDIGSGLGYGGRYLMNMYEGWEIEGLDFSQEACSKAVIKTDCFDLRTDELQLSNYDYILAVETLEHIPNSLKLLEKFCVAAKSGVILTVPYKGRISPTHPVSFDETSFNNFNNVEIHLEERTNNYNGIVKTDMLVKIIKNKMP